MLDGLYLHFERLRLFRGQNALTVAKIVIRHSENGLIVRHVADDTRHIRKSGKLACPLAAVTCDDLIAAILTGTHQRGLIDARRLTRACKLCLLLCFFQFAQLIVHYRGVSTLLIIQLFGIVIPPPNSSRKHQKERCDHSRSQRSLITFYGALRIILLSTELPATIYMLAL